MSDEERTWFVVMTLRRWSSLAVMGVPISGNSDEPACVGFLPVFDSYEAADKWRRDNEHESAGIVPIQAGDKE